MLLVSSRLDFFAHSTAQSDDADLRLLLFMRYLNRNIGFPNEYPLR